MDPSPSLAIETLNGDDGMAVCIYANTTTPGTFNAVLRDTDADAMVAARIKIPTIDAARVIAAEMLHG